MQNTKKIMGMEVAWEGTCEANFTHDGEVGARGDRVPAALVASPKRGNEKIIVKIEGKWRPENTTNFTREYEAADTGDLVTSDVCEKIEAALKRSRK